MPMDSLTHSGSVIVACPPDELYAMVSDITRMGEWSPICRECWWDDGGGPRVGAWFTGRNVLAREKQEGIRRGKKAARKLYQERFRAESVYGDFKDYLFEVAAAHRKV